MELGQGGVCGARAGRCVCVELGQGGVCVWS